jgi:hypothetical protein
MIRGSQLPPKNSSFSGGFKGQRDVPQHADLKRKFSASQGSTTGNNFKSSSSSQPSSSSNSALKTNNNAVSTAGANNNSSNGNIFDNSDTETDDDDNDRNSNKGSDNDDSDNKDKDDANKKDDSKGDGTTEQPTEELLRKKPRVARKTFTEEMLVSRNGIDLIYETFPKTCRLRGRGFEAADLKNLITHYTGWAYQLYPGMAFIDMVHRIQAFGAKASIRGRLSDLREKERNRYLVRYRIVYCCCCCTLFTLWV